MTTRWCPRGQHSKPTTAFRTATAGGKMARDCIACEQAQTEALRARRAAAGEPVSTRMDGVDIDAIHFKRGAGAPHMRRPAK